MQKLNYKFPNVYFENKKGKKFLFTRNIFPGVTAYDETLIKVGKDEYRSWNHMKSKLGAAILKGISQIGFKEGDVVLYLGAASGTTPSHVSDIVGKDGFVFCVEFSPRPARDLVFLCEKRKNMAPMLADANHPERYIDKVTGVDVIYQDISQKNQAEIFLKNCEYFLKPGGFGLLFIKARSVDVAKKPKEVFKQVRKQLEEKIIIVDYKELDPFERDHALFVCKKN